MNRKKKIALIIVYFGKLPPYFEFFLASAKKNYKVDFFLITDQSLSIPNNNIHIIETDFQEIRLKIQKLFEFQISLDTPYKLVDFKPVYGLIFKNLIQGYEYWGYCDIDQIFGDIFSFLPSNYQRFDKLFRLGHFTIFRNTDEINALFMSPIGMDYRKALSEPTIAVFDEIEGIERKFQLLGRPVFNKNVFADILWSRWRFQRTYRGENLSYMNHNKSIYFWNNGNLQQIMISDHGILNIPLMYIHFQKRYLRGDKRIASDELPFFITNEGFIGLEKAEYNSTKFIQQFDRYSVTKDIQQQLKFKVYLYNRYIHKHILKY